MDNQNPTEALPSETPLQNPPVNQPIQTSPAPTVPQSSSLQKKSFLSNKLLWLIVILIILFVSSGTYITLNSKPKAVPLVSKIEPTPTPNPTASWKTYTNQNLGLSLKYPQNVTTDFVAFDGGAGGNNVLGLKGPNYREGTDFGSGMAIWASSISGSDLKSTAVVDRQLIKQNEAAGFGQNFELSCSTQEIKIGNTTPAILQTCNNIPAHFIYIQNPKGMIVRLTTLSAGNYQSLINQILSTFRFDSP